jgi:hypothetical protein
VKIDAEVHETHVAIHVEVENAFGETVYLLNWLWDWYGVLGDPKLHATRTNRTAPPTREIAYACINAPAELVLLNGLGPESPSRVEIARPRVPYATRLRAGEVHRGTIRQPLPVREWYAYDPPADNPARVLQIRTIRYKLEVVRESAGKGPVTELKNFPGLFQAAGNRSETQEAVVALSSPLTALYRTDSFQRFI